MAGATKSTSKRKSDSAVPEGKVRLTLAHPIAPPYQAGLGLDVKDEDYGVGDDVDLYPHVARAVINAGYAQVDPEDVGQVAKALGIEEDEAKAVVAEMAGAGTVEPSSEPTG